MGLRVAVALLHAGVQGNAQQSLGPRPMAGRGDRFGVSSVFITAVTEELVLLDTESVPVFTQSVK